VDPVRISDRFENAVGSFKNGSLRSRFRIESIKPPVAMRNRSPMKKSMATTAADGSSARLGNKISPRFSINQPLTMDACSWDRRGVRLQTNDAAAVGREKSRVR